MAGQRSGLAGTCMTVAATRTGLPLNISWETPDVGLSLVVGGAIMNMGVDRCAVARLASVLHTLRGVSSEEAQRMVLPVFGRRTGSVKGEAVRADAVQTALWTLVPGEVADGHVTMASWALMVTGKWRWSKEWVARLEAGHRVGVIVFRDPSNEHSAGHVFVLWVQRGLEPGSLALRLDDDTSKRALAKLLQEVLGARALLRQWAGISPQRLRCIRDGAKLGAHDCPRTACFTMKVALLQEPGRVVDPREGTTELGGDMTLGDAYRIITMMDFPHGAEVMTPVGVLPPTAPLRVNAKH